MKKTIIILAVFLFALVPVLGAGEPTLISSWELSDTDLSIGYGGEDLSTAIYGVAVWDDGLLINTPVRSSDANSYFIHTDIYNLGGSFRWNYVSTLSCGGTDTGGTVNFRGLDGTYVKNGLVMISASTGCTGGVPTQAVTSVFDVSSSLFTSYDGGISGRPSSCPTCNINVPTGGKNIPIVIGSQEVEFINTFGYYEYNATGNVNNEGLFFTNDLPTTDDFVDLQNKIFVGLTGDEFYRYAGDSYDDFIAQTFVGTTGAGDGDVVDWNRNPNNPEYLVESGAIMLVGGSNYDNFQTSSYRVPFDALFMFERSNIIGTNGNYWAWADLSNLSAPQNETGTNPINADYIWRENDNYIVTYNSTTRVISLYQVPLPDFFEFVTEGINTAPEHEDLEFLGVDVANRFIFKNIVTDAEGGLVSQAQTVNFANENPEDLEVNVVIEFDSPEHEDYATDFSSINLNTISLIDEQPEFKIGTNFGEESLKYKVEFLNPLEIEIPTPFDSSQANFVTTGLRWSYDETYNLLGITGLNEVSTSLTYLDQDDRVIADYYIQRFRDNNTAYIFNRDTDTLLFTINMTGDDDYFNFLPNFDFDTQTVELFVVNQRDAFSTTHSFVDPLAFGWGKVRFLDEGTARAWLGDQELYVDLISYKFTYLQQQYPEYELIDLFDDGETQVFATTQPSSGYGNYILYSWLTDDTLGETNYDYLTTLAFTHDNSTETLDSNAINQIINDAQAQVEDTDGGFASPDYVEGDLVTDTFFGYLDSWNIKSTASKFFAGLIIIILFIGVGGWMGVQLKSPIVSTLGAMFGGLGAIFLVTYWGLFPAWVSFTIVLIVVTAVANLIRNSLTGQGGR